MPRVILHVEDGSDVARRFHAELESLGHRVAYHPTSVPEALALIPDALSSEPVDLAILDRDIPGGSGVRVARALRRAGFKFPIIANSIYGAALGAPAEPAVMHARVITTLATAPR
jgi:CheY-like chemotaxis protein